MMGDGQDSRYSKDGEQDGEQDGKKVEQMSRKKIILSSLVAKSRSSRKKKT
jgi:hypothetical protein